MCDRIRAILLFDERWPCNEIARVLLLSERSIRNHISDCKQFARIKGSMKLFTTTIGIARKD